MSDFLTTHLAFQAWLPTWVLALLIVPALLVFVFWTYKKPERKGTHALAALRIAVLLFVGFLAMGPHLLETEERQEKAPLVFLIDDSGSLQRTDEPGGGSRLDRATAILQSPFIDTLAERYELESWLFHQQLEPFSFEQSLTGNGPGTAVGDALNGLMEEYRGRHLPQVVLLSDGRNNTGLPPLEVAQRFAAEGSAIHVIALGNPRPAPDQGLERIQAPTRILSGDEALLTFRLIGQESLQEHPGTPFAQEVEVQLLDENGLELDRARVTHSAGGTRLTLSTVLRAPGIHHLTATIPPLPGEHALDNNQVSIAIEVVPLKIRVLYVENKPRYEYRYLKNRMLRAQDEIALRCWLADAGRDFQQEASTGLSPLRRMPTTFEELNADFDVILLGDVDPESLSPDPLAGSAFLQAVEEFVRVGGGLLMLAGENHNPSAYRGTPLEPMLPVELGHHTPDTAPFRPIPQDSELPHAVVRLQEDLGANQRFWESSSELWWHQPVDGLRPGAQAWLVHDQEMGADGQPRIIAAGRAVPDGQVAWFGTDETWRWRDPAAERWVSKMWRALLRQLASGRLEGDHGQAQLDIDRARIEIGDAVQVEARLREEALDVSSPEDTLSLRFDPEEPALSLQPVKGEPGTYRGLFRPLTLGQRTLFLTRDGTQDGEELASEFLEVVAPSLEMRWTAQDSVLLQALAEKTGGLTVTSSDLSPLLERLDGRERIVRTLASQEKPLPGKPLLILFLLLAGAEWLFRKWRDLT